MKKRSSSSPFRSMLLNAAYLGSGSVASALLGLVALSCAGRGMSTEMFGILVVIQAYAKAVSDLIKFQTWRLVVQFGMPALEANNIPRLRDSISFSFGLDIASGVVAVLGGIIALPFLSHSMGLDSTDFWLAVLYCTLIPSMTAGTPTGVLRVFGRFDLIAIQQAVKPLLQAVGSVICYVCDLGFPGFVVTWYVANLVGGSMFWWFARQELRRRDIQDALRPRLSNIKERIEGAWNFVWVTNFAHTIWAARNSCSTVIIGIILGPAAAGLFKIAMTFFDATGAPAGLLEKSFYPEIMRLDPRTKKPWKLGIRSALLAGGMGLFVALLVLIAGKPLISLVFGYKYLQAYDLIQIMLGAIIVSMAGFPLESLLLMAGKQRIFLTMQTIASGLYIVLLVVMSHLFGVQGAALAYFGGQCLDVFSSFIPTLRAYRKRHLLRYLVAKESH